MGKNFPGRGKSQSKGPDWEPCLVFLNYNKEQGVWGSGVRKREQQWEMSLGGNRELDQAGILANHSEDFAFTVSDK